MATRTMGTYQVTLVHLSGERLQKVKAYDKANAKVLAESKYPGCRATKVVQVWS